MVEESTLEDRLAAVAFPYLGVSIQKGRSTSIDSSSSGSSSSAPATTTNTTIITTIITTTTITMIINKHGVT